MLCLNRVMLIGRLGDNPVVRAVGASQVAELSLAITEKYQNAQKEMKERTEWVKVNCWGKLADIAQKFTRKGSLLYAEGKLQTDSWTDKETGAKKFKTYIYASNLIVLDNSAPKSAPRSEEPIGKPREDYAPIPADLDKSYAYDGGDNNDLPF